MRQSHGLLGRRLAWEILASHDRDMVHRRFRGAELRLSRLNIIHGFTQLPPFDRYLRTWRNYGSLFRDKLTWLATTTVFVAPALTAMQVGVATDQLMQDLNFMAASYGFTVFSILGPVCAFGFMILASLFNLAKDLPWFLQGIQLGRTKTTSREV